MRHSWLGTGIATMALAALAADVRSQSYVEVTPPASGVSASTQDSNVPANTVDNSLSTRWSGNGSGAWIQYDLGAVRTIGHVRVAVHSGNARRNNFDLLLSSDQAAWTMVFSGQSSGTTTAEETYDFADQNARYVRYLGRGATLATGAASPWNSVTEVSVFALSAAPTPTPTPGTAPTATPTPTAAPSANLALGRPATASSVEGAGFEAARAVDGNTTSRWASVEGSDPQWISVDLGASVSIARVVLRWEAAFGRAYQVQASHDGSTWSPLFSTSTGDGGVDDLTVSGSGRHVRMYGTARGTTFGYSLFELEVYGSGGSTPTPTATPTPPSGTVLRPFPQQLTFAGAIKPTNVSQAQMNDAVRTYFDYWKAAYVRPSNGVTPGGGYYVYMKGTGGTGTEITTSEAQGYGMILFALMAGHDPAAKQYFDGIYNMYDKHRSQTDPDLMSWVIDQTENPALDSNSATDGDMDIAYALLLADKQWGSAGAINYRAQAQRIITNGIKASDVNASLLRTMRGDWAAGSGADGTRASDWMTGHMRAFQAATGDAFWGSLINSTFGMVTHLTNNYAPGTGLMPDFALGNPLQPAPPNYHEHAEDGDYWWNSCRYPWRMATDAAHYNSAPARASANKMLAWLKTATGGDPNNIRVGYRLNGTPLTTDVSAAFTAPFVAAAIVDPAHQSFLNAGWTRISGWRESYYGDSINLLCMLLISGNWWPAEAVAPTPTPTPTVTPSTPVPTPTPTPTPTATPTPTPTGGPLPNVNLALHRPAVASSTEDAAAFPAARAVDGDLTTRWASAEGVDPQWIYVDLGSSQSFRRVILRWEAAYARAYQIQVSENATTWTPIHSVTTGDGGVDDLLVTGQGRYVRMNGTQRATAFGYSLYELEVWRTSEATPTPTPTPTATPSPSPAPGEVKICIIGDTGIGSPSVQTHGLCKAAGVDAILHTGDLDYTDSPSQWESFITNQMGASFPYFYVLGNHEIDNAAGYRANADARFRRLGINWVGTLTSHCAFDWRGIRFIMTTPGIGDSSAATYIRDQAAASTAPWVLSVHHQQMARMQVNTKGDTTGWGVYEEARQQGVVVWNGHAHGYGRTHLLSKMDTQTVADNTNPYTVIKGASIVVQTGLGGDSVSSAGPYATQPYWGKVSTATNGGTYGVVICTFGAGGDPKRADCLFRNVNNVEVDRWTMFSGR